ncbi:putative rRNA maturation factor [Nesterenkonia halotolerans]|uniref:Endoribonuclease YbeY n=1 Tax=Nesterenkonia halotolerans TaxID=225325 RepID=A0ABR9J473_9MICC|nr:rRNA maturation RNase YbeY [Nesterenkonia halotolerans]MBE1513795.1 putative rRNA maturation factor [Nesterenkonia halotolerans]
MSSEVQVTVEDSSGSDLISGNHLATLLDLSCFLYAKLHLSRDVALSITLVDEEAMEQLHLDWMNLPGATDVMSFPMDELIAGTADDPVTEGVLGDIVICPAVAQQQAVANGHDLGDELALLTMHGVLHLLGHDHAEPEDRETMFTLQRVLLEEYLGHPAPTPTV